jgi:hypothetical protein
MTLSIVKQKSETEDGIGTRSMTRGNLIEFGSVNRHIAGNGF